MDLFISRIRLLETIDDVGHLYLLKSNFFILFSALRIKYIYGGKIQFHATYIDFSSLTLIQSMLGCTVVWSLALLSHSEMAPGSNPSWGLCGVCILPVHA